MRRLLWLTLFLGCAHTHTPQEKSMSLLRYPNARRMDHVDTYHGHEVADPYRWLEDPDSPESRAWIEAQVKLTEAYLEQVPGRDKVRELLTRFWNYEKYGVPFKKGDSYLFYKNDGLQNHAVLYQTKDLGSDAAQAQVVIDPNTLSEDGTVSLSSVSVSDDGSRMAYGLSEGGSDWSTIHVRDLSTGKDFDDVLKWVKFSQAAWLPSAEGFYYTRYPEPQAGQKLEDANFYNKLYYHQVGTPQSKDVLVHEFPKQKTWGFGPSVSEDGKYLVVSVWKNTDDVNMVLYAPIGKTSPKLQTLIDNFDHGYRFVDNVDGEFVFRTNQEAPRGRLIAIDPNKLQSKHWREVVPQTEHTLEGADIVGGKLICHYLADAKTQVRVHDLQGKVERTVQLPGVGSAWGFSGKRTDDETFYMYTSFTTPPSIYRYDIAKDKSALLRTPELAFDPSHYETKQIFYQSKDGTKIPMFISAKKGLKRDGKRPAYLYGYGGFNISITPAFRVAPMVWMEMGGVYAVANLRGGGEYGEQWHKAGTKLQKQNVFDDFIAAAEWLIENDYTNSNKLAIGGRSNGGLLVGAVMTQRPDLFAAAIPAVGVLDMLRFHKFTIGWAWVSDYGSSDDPEHFKALLAYSPLHNIREGTEYPATMVVTSDHDDRVVPAHSFKFGAALQHAHKGQNPILMRIDTKAGHGALTPTSKRIDEQADEWTFLVGALDMDLGDVQAKDSTEKQAFTSE